MIRTAALLLALSSTAAVAQSLPVIQKTARATGSVAPANTFVSDTMDVARAMQSKTDTVNGQLANPVITGGTATGTALTAPTVAGGTFTGGDVSGQMVLPARGATTMRSQAAIAGDFVTPASFLAAGQTEAALRSAGIDAGPAINAGWARGGVRLPCGNYRLDTPIAATVSNSALIGESEGCVRIFINFADGDAVNIPAGLGNVRIERIQFLPQMTRTSGAVIGISGTNAVLENIRLDGTGGFRLADGVVVRAGAIATHVGQFYFSSANGDCLRVEGYALDTHVRNGTATGCGAGMHLKSGSGIYLSDLDLVGSLVSGVVVDPVAGAGEKVDAIYATTVLSDTSQENGWVFIGDGHITEVNLNNTWAGASGTTNTFQPNQAITQAAAGYYFNNPNINGVAMTGVRAKGNGGHGISIANGRNITIGTGTQVLMNGAAYGQPGVTTRYNGIEIDGPSTNIIVMGVTGGPGGWEQITAGKPIQQAYGLYRSPSTGGQTITVMGSQFPGNVVAGYAIGSATGDHIVDLGNQQF